MKIFKIKVLELLGFKCLITDVCTFFKYVVLCCYRFNIRLDDVKFDLIMVIYNTIKPHNFMYSLSVVNKHVEDLSVLQFLFSVKPFAMF